VAGRFAPIVRPAQPYPPAQRYFFLQRVTNWARYRFGLHLKHFQPHLSRRLRLARKPFDSKELGMKNPVRQSVADRWSHIAISCLMACTVLAIYTLTPLMRAIQPVWAASVSYCVQAAMLAAAIPSFTLYTAAGLTIVVVSGWSISKASSI